LKVNGGSPLLRKQTQERKNFITKTECAKSSGTSPSQSHDLRLCNRESEEQLNNWE
jgi:hypothetical protein